uniref:Uncharacterized protein n=1 Tax=Clytia hemisphaerica TaxID=252671 RepID=A0A7M5UW58_9CNID
MLAFIMIPIIQRHLDEFKDLIWNSHRIRHQKNTYMADGVPNHMYDFPRRYSMEQCGKPLDVDKLDQAVQITDVMNYGNDFLSPDQRNNYEQIVNNVVTEKNYVQCYLELKYSQI